MTPKISLYWKCQLVGWTLLCLSHIFSLWAMFGFRRTEILMAAVNVATGLPVSHLMRIAIVRLKVVQKTIKQQVVHGLLMTLIFAIVSSFAWLGVISRFEYQFISAPNFWGRYVALLNESFSLLLTWNFIYFTFHYVQNVRTRERARAEMQYKIAELEALALRSQMNPHFIFNCMNSIKALIQQDEKGSAIDYLTTFSKLIRAIFQNSGKREVSLHDELETCRLYVQLEAMRFKGKLNYHFEISPGIDLKSITVPALIVQPFIENAIWHGVVPKDEGIIKIAITENDGAVICEVDDNGIGREMSMRNKPNTTVMHESRGVHLSRVRLNLEKMLNNTNASIEIVDKYENETPVGTKVIISFNLN